MLKSSNNPLPCYMANRSLSIGPTGQVRNCCQAKNLSNSTFLNKGFVNDKNSIKTVYNSSELKRVRTQLIKGTWPKECVYCQEAEEAGMDSLRQISNFEHNYTLSKKDFKNLSYENIEYLDITLGNICNLKCRTCNPWVSHSWIDEYNDVTGKLTHPEKEVYKTVVKAADIVKNPWFVNAFKNNYFDPILPNLKHINFLGGEPLVVKEHYVWLRQIVEKGFSKNITLRYNTNGSTIPKELLEIWKDFKKIILSVSIDATEDLAHYVRYPSKWKIISRNLQKLEIYSKKYKNITVHLSTTISSLNLHGLPDLLEWSRLQYNNWCIEDEVGYYGFVNAIPHFNIVHYPNFFHIQHIPDKNKDFFISLINEEYEKSKNSSYSPWEKEKIKNILGINEHLTKTGNILEWNKFVEVTKASDRYRGVNIVDYIPWMKEYF